MQDDASRIRELVSQWHAATRAGDTETVLALISEDAVFLLAGRPPMNKQEFAAQSRQQSGPAMPQIDAHSEIEELIVSGDWAFMRSAISVTITPRDGKPALERSGHTLTVFQKTNGSWLLARDANLLAAKPDAAN